MCVCVCVYIYIYIYMCVCIYVCMWGCSTPLNELTSSSEAPPEPSLGAADAGPFSIA